MCPSRQIRPDNFCNFLIGGGRRRGIISLICLLTGTLSLDVIILTCSPEKLEDLRPEILHRRSSKFPNIIHGIPLPNSQIHSECQDLLGHISVATLATKQKHKQMQLDDRYRCKRHIVFSCFSNSLIFFLATLIACIRILPYFMLH